MDLDLFKQILNKAEDESIPMGVSLFNWGEPFTHPRLSAFIHEIRSRNLICYLSSNLNAIPHIEAVMAAEPDWFRISCSGFSQETYSRTHKQGNISEVKLNMKRVAHLRRPRTKVHLLWHSYLHNEHERQWMEGYCNVLGFEFRPIEAYYMPLEKVLDVWRGKEPTPELNDILIHSLWEYEKSCWGRKDEPCALQDHTITMDAAGRVQLCCAVYSAEKFTVGNFLEMPIEEIQAHRKSHSFCDTCTDMGGHLYATGRAFKADSKWRLAAKKVYVNMAPLVPRRIAAHFMQA